MIKIEAQEYKIPIATTTGWITPVGLIGNINDVKVSFFVVCPNGQTELDISELSSGSLIKKYMLSKEEVLACDTQKKLIGLLFVYSARTAIIIQNTKNFKGYIDKAKAKTVNEFGPMPKLEETTIQEVASMIRFLRRYFNLGNYVYRRVGPKLYKTKYRSDRQKLKDDWRKVNADLWKSFRRYI